MINGQMCVLNLNVRIIINLGLEFLYLQSEIYYLLGNLKNYSQSYVLEESNVWTYIIQLKHLILTMNTKYKLTSSLIQMFLDFMNLKFTKSCSLFIICNEIILNLI